MKIVINDVLHEVEGPYLDKENNKEYYLLAREVDTAFGSGSSKELIEVSTLNKQINSEESGWKELKTCNYGGYLIPLETLEVGKRFYVCNGHWYGIILEKDGVKGVMVEGFEPNFHPLTKCNPDLYINLKNNIFKK